MKNEICYSSQPNPRFKCSDHCPDRYSVAQVGQHWSTQLIDALNEDYILCPTLVCSLRSLTLRSLRTESTPIVDFIRRVESDRHSVQLWLNRMCTCARYSVAQVDQHWSHQHNITEWLVLSLSDCCQSFGLSDSTPGLCLTE